MAGLRKCLLIALFVIVAAESEAKTIMIDTFFFGKSFIQSFKASSEANEVFLFLPGFPAERGKNEDLAEAIADTLNIDVYLIHYEGLGKSEKTEFSFQRTIDGPISYAEYLLTNCGYQKLNLVGHSWGGVVAINIKNVLKDKINKIVLMAPFTNVPDEERSKLILNYTKQEYPEIADRLDVEKLVKELVIIRDLNHPWKLADKLDLDPNEVMILQGTNDDEVNPNDTRHFVELLPTGIKYIELNDNHAFSDRQRLINKVLGWLTGDKQN